MQNQIFPLNVDPESPLKPVNKKKKPTFKQWFNERKRMLGLVFGVCLVTVGVIVYPYLNLGDLGKGLLQLIDNKLEINYDFKNPDGEINLKLSQDVEEADDITTDWEAISSDKDLNISWNYTAASKTCVEGTSVKIDLINSDFNLLDSLQYYDTCSAESVFKFEKFIEQKEIRIKVKVSNQVKTIFDSAQTGSITVNKTIVIDEIKLNGEVYETGTKKILNDKYLEITFTSNHHRYYAELLDENRNTIIEKNSYMGSDVYQIDSSELKTGINKFILRCWNNFGDSVEKEILIEVPLVLNPDLDIKEVQDLQVTGPIITDAILQEQSVTSINNFIPSTDLSFDIKDVPGFQIDPSILENFAAKINSFNMLPSSGAIKDETQKIIFNYDALNFQTAIITIKDKQSSKVVAVNFIDKDHSNGKWEWYGKGSIYTNNLLLESDGAPVEESNLSKGDYLAKLTLLSYNNDLDENGDGTLTSNEINLDQNGDGKVTLEEGDLNGDGEINLMDLLTINAESQEYEIHLGQDQISFSADQLTLNRTDTANLKPIKFTYDVNGLATLEKNQNLETVVKINIKKDGVNYSGMTVKNLREGTLEWKGNKTQCVSVSCTPEPATYGYEDGEYSAYLSILTPNLGGAGLYNTLYEDSTPLKITVSSNTTEPQTENPTPSITATLTATPPSPTTLGTTGSTVVFALTPSADGTCSIEFETGKTSMPAACKAGQPYSASHTYTTAGTYTVKGLVNGTPITTQQYIVNPPVNTPSLAISPSPKSPEIDTGDDDVEVKFTLTVTNLTGPYDYKIEYGDGETDFKDAQTTNTYTFSHKYDDDDDYTVKATVKTAGGEATTTYALEVTREEDDDDDEKDDDLAAIKITNVSSTKNNLDPSVNTAEIRYTLSDEAVVTVEILDTSKKTVATLVDEKTQKKGAQSTIFTGRVDNKDGGQILPGGSYTYKITAVHPDDEDLETSKTGTITLVAAGQYDTDWEQTGAVVAANPTSASSGSTTTAPTSGTLRTVTSGSANLAALTMQNNPPGTTAGTGPEMLIYLVFPAISAFVLTRKK